MTWSVGKRMLVAITAATLCVAGSTFAVATAAPDVERAGLAGYCPDANGVTVAVDYQDLGAATEIRCAVGPQATGLAALENAGFVVTGTDRWGKAFVCRINGQPTAATESCVNTPPATAYWSYWHATNGGAWAYSTQGASASHPAPGSFEGWSFSLNHGPNDNPAPRVDPTRPAAPKASPPPADALAEPADQPAEEPADEPANPHTDAGKQGTAWLSGELTDGTLPGFAGPDWGLSIDALLAFAATGDDASANAVADQVAAHVRSYNSFDDFGQEGVRIAGATAKILVAALAVDRDVTDFGGYDLRQETLDLIAPASAGDNAGRARDLGTADQSNTFAQSFAVLGLARTGGVPESAVEFLLRQQCSSGGFRLSPDQFGTPAPTCDAATDPVLDPDSTAMAVQALLVSDVDGADVAAAKGAGWLASIQHADGSFGGSGPTADANTNSTGLAAEALAATGHITEADQAADYIAAHQLSTANAGAANAELGAIAYNDASFDEAVASGLTDLARDQWRRAGAQAILGLAKVPLGALGKDQTPPPGPVDALADYLVAQLVDGNHIEGSFGEDTFVDYGQTTDVAFALLTTGKHPDTLTAVLDFLATADSVAAYAHGAPFDKPGAHYAGATAKLAFLVALAGRDSHAVGGFDLIAELTALQRDSGRFADDSDFGDFANVFGQAFGVLALTATGETEPAANAVAALVAAQCTDHTYPVDFADSCATGTADTTGLAVQALNAAPAAGALPADRHDALVAAANALAAQRDTDGAWAGPGGQNVNSTGYAAMGLVAVGQQVTASRDWLTGLQGSDGGLPINPGQASNAFASAQAAPALAGRSFLTSGSGAVVPAETVAPVETPPGEEPPGEQPPGQQPPGAQPPGGHAVGGGGPVPQGSPAPSGLAQTGFSVLALLFSAMLLLGGGFAARRLARRHGSGAAT